MIELLHRTRIVAILRLDDLTDAEPIVRSLLAGGIRFIEFTLTNPQASEKVALLRRKIVEFVSEQAAIGLGSVRTLAEAQLALDSGAQFIVSPITNVEIIRLCKARKIPVMPGAMTPTEMYLAWSHGAEVIKLFPASNLGPSYLKDVLAPMPFLQVMPTGGVTLENMQSYFDVGAVAVGIGSNLIPKRLIANKDWKGIEAIGSEYANRGAKCTTS